VTKGIVPSAIINITGLRRYTVADIAVRDGVSEA